MRTRDILCPIDFSETSTHALGYAVEMASLYGVNIRLLNVVTLPYVGPDYGIILDNPTGLLHDFETIANDKMKAIVAEVREQMPKGLMVHTKVRSGGILDQILEEADEQNVGMIVIASQGLTGLSHMLTANIAESVANQAKCPVLVVK
ncbi:universal stress protein [Shewanella schlegeliana]|uniref:Universal stress protein n=1 Tax=Shewanella schlegeliana TaxID=190308 RepID=A0ABS1SY02_9GAMM|nr:universal stress protein [Shewanella schlegeliana]MBL4913402.1 universal stress protein [Shewanella schlegeliana]MCL1108291.1 universal stress protein [Shewanella schlegeliana]GIU34570.1 universal stress protein A [Shewanella schlegeliana]